MGKCVVGACGEKEWDGERGHAILRSARYGAAYHCGMVTMSILRMHARANVLFRSVQ